MKKIILISIAFLFATMLFAQSDDVPICESACTPDTLGGFSTGIIPMSPTNENIPNPVVGCPYELCVTVKMPPTINYPPYLSNVAYDSIVFTGFSGLPPGFDYCLETANLKPNEIKTVHFYGTATTPGLYKIQLSVKVIKGFEIPLRDQESGVEITVVEAEAPVAGFTASATTIPVGGTVNFTNVSTNCESDCCTYAWTFDGGSPATSTDENPAVTYSASGTYDAKLTVTNPAGSDSKTMTITVEEGSTGIVDGSATGIKVYPNPTDGELHVEADGLGAITIYDLAGRELLHTMAASNHEVIAVGALPKATYIMRVQTANGPALLRVVIK